MNSEFGRHDPNSSASPVGPAEALAPAVEIAHLPKPSFARRLSVVVALLLLVASMGIAVTVQMLGPRFEESFRHADVALIRTATTIFAAILAVGPVVFMGAVWLAVSRERRQAEALSLLRDNREVLRNSRDQLQRVFASLPLPYVLARMDGTLVQANRQALSLFEVDAAALRQTNVFDFYADENFVEELRGYLDGNGHIENLEITLRSASGREFWVLFSAARVELDGELLQFAAFSDITERKRIERALQENDQALRAIIDASPMATVLTDLDDGCVVYINQAAGAMFGQKMPDAQGMDAAFYWENPDQRERMREELRKSGSVTAFEVRLKDSGGQPFWAEISATVVRFKGTSLVHVAVIDVTERKRKETELHMLATTDPLTGALNRRAFGERSAVEYERGRRGKYPLSVMIVDLDHFKKVNDTHGHASGDVVLKHFTAIVGELIRPGDVLGRIGGEEFAILLPGSDLDSGARVADRLRGRFADTPVVLANGQSLRATASIGVAPWQVGETLDAALNAADGALYRAKAEGRNCVRVAANAPVAG